MKRIFLSIAVSCFALISASAQHVVWASTNALPASLTNVSTTVSTAGISDGAGTTAWLVTGSSFIFVPFPTTTYSQQLVWLDKAGRLFWREVISLEGATNPLASLVRVSRTDLLVQIHGTAQFTNTVNLLRRYTVSHTGLTFTDTPLETNEAAAPAVLAGISTTPAPDKTGFFTVTLGTPTIPELVVRRYSNK